MISGRYNYGKSEISVNVRYIQRKGDWTREYDERFIFPTMNFIAWKPESQRCSIRNC